MGRAQQDDQQRRSRTDVRRRDPVAGLDGGARPVTTSAPRGRRAGLLGRPQALQRRERGLLRVECSAVLLSWINSSARPVRRVRRRPPVPARVGRGDRQSEHLAARIAPSRSLNANPIADPSIGRCRSPLGSVGLNRPASTASPTVAVPKSSAWSARPAWIIPLSIDAKAGRGATARQVRAQARSRPVPRVPTSMPASAGGHRTVAAGHRSCCAASGVQAERRHVGGVARVRGDARRRATGSRTAIHRCGTAPGSRTRAHLRGGTGDDRRSPSAAAFRLHRVAAAGPADQLGRCGVRRNRSICQLASLPATTRNNGAATARRRQRAKRADRAATPGSWSACRHRAVVRPLQLQRIAIEHRSGLGRSVVFFRPAS
jgi:hypothetical protein